VPDSANDAIVHRVINRHSPKFELRRKKFFHSRSVIDPLSGFLPENSFTPAFRQLPDSGIQSRLSDLAKTGDSTSLRSSGNRRKQIDSPESVTPIDRDLNSERSTKVSNQIRM
jgi:hypothetical protein